MGRYTILEKDNMVTIYRIKNFELQLEFKLLLSYSFNWNNINVQLQNTQMEANI